MAPLFADEFSGSGIDTGSWLQCYPWGYSDGCTNEGNNELQWYRPGNLIEANGSLSLQAQKQSYAGSNGHTYPYTSGLIASKSSWTYGYFEMSASIPGGKGTWPAFWMLPKDQTWPPEFDILENFGKSTEDCMNVHYASTQDQTCYNGVDLTSGFHTYGLDWQPTYLKFYIDGVLRKTVTNKAEIPTKPMYVIACLAINGSDPPDSGVAFPRSLVLDYVRVYASKP